MMRKIPIVFGLMLAVIASLAFADDSEIVSVKGKGVGVDETAALKDAYRDVVETAVGLYVDAEQMVKNDEVVEDQILTQSNAYIESYEVLKKTIVNGVCTIKILAKVKTKVLTKKLSTTTKAQTVDVGSGLRNLYAKEVSKKKSGEEGAALLKNVIEKLDPKQLIDVTLTDVDPVVFNKNDDTSKELKMAYLFRQMINEDRYFSEFMPPLHEVLTQISITAPSKTALSVSARESFNLKKCLGSHSPAYRRSLNFLGSQRCEASVASPEIGKMGSSSFSLSNCLKNYSNFTKVHVILVTKVNKLHTIFTCEIYELDKYAAKVLSEWQSAVAWDIFARLTFVDEGGEELVRTSVRTGDFGDLKCCAMKSFYNTRREQQFFVFAPWFLNGFSRSSVFERYDWREVAVSKDALPLIKKIKVDLVK